MNFDHVARVYRLLECAVFGGALQRARVRWLDALETPQRALVIGEGDGRFLSEVTRVYPNLEIDCVEASAEMIALARRRLGSTGSNPSSIRFIQEDVRDWVPAGRYDLVVTHFFLDCFDEKELEGIVRKIAATLSVGGIWLLADFTLPKRGPGEVCAQLLIPVMYAFFRLTARLQTSRLIDPTERMVAQGLVCHRRALLFGGMVKSELWRNERLPDFK